MKRIVIFGNQQISIDCVNWLLKDRNIQIVAFVGCETPRDKKYGYPSISKFCKKNNIFYINANVLDKKFISVFKKWKVDICFSIYFRKIFPSKLLKIPPMGFINIHPSLLPKYRGSMPTFWALMNNEKIIGVTLHYIDSDIDTGDIIAQKSYLIPSKITGAQLNNNIRHIAFNLFKKSFHNIIIGNVKAKKQKHYLASYYGQFNQMLRRIDWNSTSNQIINKVRILAKPYDGAVVYLNKHKIIIYEAKKIILSKRKLKGPGKLIRVYKNNQFVVSTVDGYLLITSSCLKSFSDVSVLSSYIGKKFE